MNSYTIFFTVLVWVDYFHPWRLVVWHSSLSFLPNRAPRLCWWNSRPTKTRRPKGISLLPGSFWISRAPWCFWLFGLSFSDSSSAPTARENEHDLDLFQFPKIESRIFFGFPDTLVLVSYLLRNWKRLADILPDKLCDTTKPIRCDFYERIDSFTHYKAAASCRGTNPIVIRKKVVHWLENWLNPILRKWHFFLTAWKVEFMIFASNYKSALGGRITYTSG